MQVVEELAKAEASQWLNTIEVARLAGRDPRVIRKLVEDGVLPAHRPGRCRPLFARADVERFLATTGSMSAN